MVPWRDERQADGHAVRAYKARNIDDRCMEHAPHELERRVAGEPHRLVCDWRLARHGRRDEAGEAACDLVHDGAEGADEVVCVELVRSGHLGVVLDVRDDERVEEVLRAEVVAEEGGASFSREDMAGRDGSRSAEA